MSRARTAPNGLRALFIWAGRLRHVRVALKPLMGVPDLNQQGSEAYARLHGSRCACIEHYAGAL